MQKHMQTTNDITGGHIPTSIRIHASTPYSPPVSIGGSQAKNRDTFWNRRHVMITLWESGGLLLKIPQVCW